MSDLVAFIEARLAEDHAAADLVLRPYGDHAATNEAEWWADERTWWRDHNLSSDETALLVRMTPQRVLAGVAAKRRVLELHQPQQDRPGSLITWTYCSCGARKIYDEPEMGGRYIGNVRFPCDTMRALASEWAGVPGWDDGWAL